MGDVFGNVLAIVFRDVFGLSWVMSLGRLSEGVLGECLWGARIGGVFGAVVAVALDDVSSEGCWGVVFGGGYFWGCPCQCL